MAVYIVTYDLNREIKRPPVLDVIKTYSWAKLSESSYAISTSDSTAAVYNRIRPLLDDNDNLYVIPLKSPFMGWGPKDVNEWLERNLRS